MISVCGTWKACSSYGNRNNLVIRDQREYIGICRRISGMATGIIMF